MREKNGRERKREKQSEKLERKRNIERRRKKQRKREGEREREIRRSIISKVLYDFFKSNSSVGDNSVSENCTLSVIVLSEFQRQKYSNFS